MAIFRYARGVGLLACIEFVADKATRTLFDPSLQVGPRLAAACRDEGLIVRSLPDGDMLGYSPPLLVNGLHAPSAAVGSLDPERTFSGARPEVQMREVSPVPWQGCAVSPAV